MKPSIQQRLRVSMLAVISSFVFLGHTAAAVELPGTELLPVVPGDVETRSTPFIAWFQDLSLVGYVEEEYAVSGTANLYDYVDDIGQRPDIVVSTPDVPYTTRMLVRRPADARDFNGTVFVEVLNATAGWDGDPIWQSTFVNVKLVCVARWDERNTPRMTRTTARERAWDHRSAREWPAPIRRAYEKGMATPTMNMKDGWIRSQ